MRTIVYIDGFNLYYRLLRSNPQFKWLDLRALSLSLLQAQNQVQTIRYYTARVSGRFDPAAPARQQVYLDALASQNGGVDRSNAMMAFPSEVTR